MLGEYHCVKVAKFSSSEEGISTYGVRKKAHKLIGREVPQGSIIGPTLSIISINHLLLNIVNEFLDNPEILNYLTKIGKSFFSFGRVVPRSTIFLNFKI